MEARSFFFFSLIGTGSVCLWLNWDEVSPMMRRIPIVLTQQTNFIPKYNISKWIVVTSIQYPTEDIKNLAAQTDWTLVVVADKKTPVDWEYSGVHFLSIEQQLELGSFANLLPFGSYTRKNLGYLYALMNGAKWIYDTDDDNKPFGLGLNQFDYENTVSGLRYTPKSNNLSERLFNPYQFYGYGKKSKMWPRGFPLEYLKGHTNGKDRQILCHKMKTAAIQQGLVRKDPDVDAIYRLLNADRDTGLHATFNKFAPPITLEAGTYSPWNSQNTLFSYRAFFTMFLPTTVAFRVTDIWRSYFAQKLLHLIGEEMAFYPVNAVQFRNAHNYLKDFDQEIDVYKKSGDMIHFLDKWICPQETIDDCTIELAQTFVQQGFWEEYDLILVKEWIKALRKIGYEFPPIVISSENNLYKYNKEEIFGNCRPINIDLGVEDYDPDTSDQEYFKAANAIQGFKEILNWCNKAINVSLNETLKLPLAEEFGEKISNETLATRQNQVLVLINNFPWKTSIALLQRMYSPFFAVTLFCGTWNPNNFTKEELKILEPINYISMSTNEMKNGWYYHYCFSKAKDLRLQNVDGYFFVADDTLFNFWYEIPVDKVNQPVSIDYHSTMYWSRKTGEKFIQLVEGKYKDDGDVQKAWKRYEAGLLEMGINLTAKEHMTNFTGKACHDYLYVPTSYMDFFSPMIEVSVETGMFVENFMPKLLHSIKYNKEGGFFSLWTGDRGRSFREYLKSRIGVHPIKLSLVQNDLKQRKNFCDNVISRFVREIFWA